jgi:hypothetical protein
MAEARDVDTAWLWLSERRPGTRGATALCQGIIRCGVCGERVGTRYGRKDCKVTYKCVEPISRCRMVTADTVDDAVAELFLKTITPQQIQVALAAADEVADRQVRTHRAAELAAERARYAADRAERAFGQVEPENRLVARILGITVGAEACRVSRS